MNSGNVVLYLNQMKSERWSCYHCAGFIFAGKEFNVQAKCIVNATGPYTDFVRQKDNPDVKKICQPSSGVHVILPDYYR